MKAKTFENLIRKIVREEIDYSLHRELKSLKEDLRNESKPTITEHIENLIETPEIYPQETSLKEKIMGKSPLKQRQKMSFVENSTLNDLLNETANGDTNTQTGNAPVSLSDPFASGGTLPMGTEGMPAEVASAVTRDYSDLMKAIDKKKRK